MDSLTFPDESLCNSYLIFKYLFFLLFFLRQILLYSKLTLNLLQSSCLSLLGAGLQAPTMSLPKKNIFIFMVLLMQV